MRQASERISPLTSLWRSFAEDNISMVRSIPYALRWQDSGASKLLALPQPTSRTELPRLTNLRNLLSTAARTQPVEAVADRLLPCWIALSVQYALLRARLAKYSDCSFVIIVTRYALRTVIRCFSSTP